MTTNIKPVLTIADLVRIPDDGNTYELLGGEIYMSRSPGLTHQITLQNLQMSLVAFVTENPIGVVVPGPGAIFDNFNSVIPDVVFFRHERRSEIVSGETLTGAPDLVIEIISPGSENRRRDRVVKRSVYGSFGVKEYWLVDPRNRSVEVFELAEEGLELTATYTGNDEMISSVLPGFRASLANLFAM
jgi:Uma2 family endonuclease